MADLQPVIHARGLTKIYTTGQTSVRALNNVDLRVEAGEKMAVTMLGSQHHPLLRVEFRFAVGARILPAHDHSLGEE